VKVVGKQMKTASKTANCLQRENRLPKERVFSTTRHSTREKYKYYRSEQL
jgi:hypothetical protein